MQLWADYMSNTLFYVLFISCFVWIRIYLKIKNFCIASFTLNQWITFKVDISWNLKKKKKKEYIHFKSSYSMD